MRKTLEGGEVDYVIEMFLTLESLRQLFGEMYDFTEKDCNYLEKAPWTVPPWIRNTGKIVKSSGNAD